MATASAPKIEALSSTLDVANRVMIGSLVVAAIAAVVVAVSTFLVIRWQGQLDKLKDNAFEAYKIEAGKTVAAAGAIAATANQAAAEANAKAAEAQLALAKIRLPRQLDASKLARIKALAREFPGTHFTIGVFNDQGSIGLSAQIDSALVEGGWIEEEWKSGGDLVLSRPPRPSFGFTMVTGLYVQADQSRGLEFATIVQRLSEVIAGNDLIVRPQIGRMPANTNNDAIKILVGQKEL